jgi:hypothetical protein
LAGPGRFVEFGKLNVCAPGCRVGAPDWYQYRGFIYTYRAIR